jgi:hypothetical protein
MKILSNFDTKLYENLKQDYIEQYGSENVMVIRRASIFFWLYIMFPLLVLLVVLALMAWLSFGVTIKDQVMENMIHITSLITGVVVL